MSGTRRLLELGAEVRKVLEQAPSCTGSPQATRELLVALTARRRPALRGRTVGGAAAFAACVVLAASVVRLTRPLTFDIGASKGSIGAALVAPAQSELALSFSDGTRIALLPGARGSVEHLGARGADIVLEAGAARVDVNHRLAAKWRVKAGPFAVTVTGTRFVVAWNAARDALQLDLFQGSVDVTGCALATPQQIVAGQRLVAECAAGRVGITPLRTAVETPLRTTPRDSPLSNDSALSESGVVAPSAAPSVPVKRVEAPPPPGSPSAGGAAVARASPAAPTAPPAPASDWLTLARTGSFGPAFAKANTSGIHAQLPSISEEELVLYADSARLSGHATEARRSYELLRSRYIGTRQSTAAAFALARLAIDRGERESAAAWFQTYLDEAPSGRLASAALGRLLELSVEGHRAARARELAQLYLARFPSGTHVELAKRILRAGTDDVETVLPGR